VEADDIELPDGASRPRGELPSVPLSDVPRPRRIDDGGPVSSPEPGAVVSVVPSSRAPARRETISGHKNDEKQRILAALERCNWNRVRAAEALGMARRTFYRRLREYDIQ